MGTGTTKRDSNLYVDILQEAVAGAFVGKQALLGTGVVALKDGMPTRDANGISLESGDTISIPYWDSLGELDDVPEGDALVPRKLASTKEQASVVRSGLAGEVTTWARLASQAGDPYAEFGRQFVVAAMRRIDKGAIDAGLTTTLSYTAGGSITEDAVIEASEKWGDELDDENGVALLVVHPMVRKKMRQLKDSTGRRLYLEPEVGPGGKMVTLPRFCGIPTFASARMPVSGTSYTSLLCKRGAIGAWFNGNPLPEEDRDVLAGSDVTAIWLYHVEHLYKRPAGGTKPGVVKLITTET